ncbi:hypothetical protein F3Y22_tig00110264pilonHSYRG00304 [Hibiscus syriacus]|uniref:Dof zinc finger protein n=1 Tax=Hibiscus syriacus TaxID=106335 RepID=A0A6A3B8K2_HIBSY|nr:dof zinc finger protein DOF3.6-like isoform X2 [Hibiscus syriacus]KAE8712098.1 hypothetical protein F3Y22_tig00110264pilonHSYRG00304 [Hibiscus syriacus]
MAFSYVPVYLDPPDWQQPQTHQQAGVIDNESHGSSQLPPPSPAANVAGGTGGKKPNSMAEQARLAKIPQPESALKCPRCESTNTKFCYFNNYSLSQPRHFCKTCRRYWTRGGALRNVPVGGGCRRNKRRKGSNRSKSPSVVSERRADSNSSSGTLASNSCTDVLGHMNLAVPQLPLFPPLHHLGGYDSGDTRLSFGGIQTQVAVTGGGTDMDFQGSTSGLVEQWRSLQQVQQFPFLTGLEQHQNELYPFESEGVRLPPTYNAHHLLLSKPPERTITQLAAVKIEDFQGLNLSRNFLGISDNDHQYWGGNAGNSCTEFSGFIKEKSSHR